MFKTHLVNRFKVYRGGKQLIGIAGELNLPKITNLVESLEGAGAYQRGRTDPDTFSWTWFLP